MRLGPLRVGDMVEYEVRRTENSLHLLSINSKKLNYVDHLEYHFTAQDTDVGESDVDITLTAHARQAAYLTVWHALEGQIVEMIHAAIIEHLTSVEDGRHQALQLSEL